MTVHHVINSYSNQSGGAEKLVRSLHLGLRAAGRGSAILGIEAQEDDEEEGAVCLQLKSSYRLIAFWKIFCYIRQNVRRDDIVHAHLFPSILYVSLLNQLGLIKARVVMTEHNTSNSRRNSTVGSLIDRVLYCGFDRIYAISHGVEEALLRWRPELGARTRVVLNGVNLFFCKPILRTKTDRPIILSIGNLRESKNYEAMLSAVAHLGEKDFEYWIAGSGEKLPHLQRVAASMGIDEKVRFLGHVANLPPILEQADIFLMASKWEGFGMAAVEAMNATLPLVVSDVPGITEVVNSAPPCAIIVRPDSAASIAEGLGQLLASLQMRNELGAHAFERAKIFTLGKMNDSYIHEYDALRTQ